MALTSMIAAAPSALHTTPTSRIACGDVLPAARATRNTDATVARAPAKAASGTSGDTGSAPATSAIAPATAAPAETPSRCGSASGLPRSAWSAADDGAQQDARQAGTKEDGEVRRVVATRCECRPQARAHRTDQRRAHHRRDEQRAEAGRGHRQPAAGEM